MARKGKKKAISSPGYPNTSSKNCSIIKDEESTDQALSNKPQVPSQFTILLDFKDTYSKLLKTSNVMLLHPSIVKSFQTPRFFLVQGKKDSSLCMAFNLKDIKRSTVVFRKSIRTFEHEEVILLQPYNKPVYNAAHVTVSLNTEKSIDNELKDEILNILRCKRYFYSDMTINQGTNDFTIIDILAKENDTICDLDGLNVSDFENTSNSVYDNSNMLLHESIHRKLLTKNVHNRSRSQQFNQSSSSQLNSMFSSMCLSDSEYKDTEYCSQSNTSDVELNIEASVPTFYTLDHATSISVVGNSTKPDSCSPCFPHIGGLVDEIQRVKKAVERLLSSKNNLSTLDVLLLLGPSGTGKTLTLEAIRSEYDVQIEEIAWFKLFLKTPTDARQELQQILQRASEKAPSIILLDDFNYLCPKTKDLQNHRISQIMSHFIENCVDHKILIVAASNKSEYNHEVLKAGETNVEEIRFRIPTSEEREDIFIKLLSFRQHNLSPNEIKQCVMHSQGFTGKDLNCVLNDALTFQYMRANKDLSSSDSNDKVITFADVKQALKYKKPSIVGSNVKIRKVRWGDIGGMRGIKEKLQDIIEGPLKYPEIYKRFGITPSKGVLLFGPPGCSKTMIAKALATECDLNFISKNVSDIQNKYVGESEKAVRELFRLAREKAPCIIFLDEIDALVTGRGSSESGVEERIVNSFLQEMDGLEELRNVMIIAATNRPDRLDAAFVRSGRINHLIYIPLPDLEAREEILKLQMKNRTVAQDFDYKYLALKTEGYTGAEIVNICNEAAFQVLAEDVESESAVFTMRHFENSLKSIFPRTPIELLEFYNSYNTQFGSK